MTIIRVGGDSSPHLEQVECTDRWRFVSPWSIEIDGVVFEFLPGFTYDRSSAQGLLAWAKDKLGSAAPAVHDLLSRYGGRVPIDGGSTTRATLRPWRPYSRREADAIYRDIVIQRGGGTTLAWAAYWVLRAAGWYAWKD